MLAIVRDSSRLAPPGGNVVSAPHQQWFTQSGRGVLQDEAGESVFPDFSGVPAAVLEKAGFVVVSSLPHVCSGSGWLMDLS